MTRLRLNTEVFRLLSELLAPLPRELAKTLAEELSSGLERYSGAATTRAILDEHDPTWSPKVH